LVADNSAEGPDGLGLDGNFGADKLVANFDGGKYFIVTILEFPVKLLDALIATSRDFMDRREVLRWLIDKLEA
jgi:hypothetical protein